MNAVVFLGPSLPQRQAREALDAVYLPPVAQGDVYRVARFQPKIIGIVDGYFERVPAVWHKEILWAMAEGIHVLGAASMGALRAAELHPFGMEGVGPIWEAFRDGDLEDDDEVAVAHLTAADGYRATSEAMVSIRCTLGEAEKSGIIAASTRTALLDAAKRTFFPERTYPLLLEKGRAGGLPAHELDVLRAWLPGHRVDQKRDDALALLETVGRRLQDGIEAKRVTYRFAHTDMWDEVVSSLGEYGLENDHVGLATETHVGNERTIDELRLQGEPYRQAWRAAFAQMLAVHETHRQSMHLTASTLERAGDAWRRRYDLVDPEMLQAWMCEQELSPGELDRLLADSARVSWIEELLRAEVIYRLPAYLRLNGDYGRLLARAREKERLTPTPGSLADAGVTEEHLWRWYFEERLGTTIPEDLEEYAQSLHWSATDVMRRAVLREYCYARLQARASTKRNESPLE